MDGGHASTSSSEDPEDETANESDEQPLLQSQASAPQGTDGPSAAQPSSIPTQKRRRVTRACDECRRKKIKCDGMQPCTHCTIYSYECTYDKPSNRRRNPTPQYVEALEHRLQRAEALLRNVLPDVSLENSGFDSGFPQRMNPRVKQETPSQKPPSTEAHLRSNRPHIDGDRSSGSSDNLLESMVDHTGSLDLDDQGNWDYHGQSSGLVYLRCLREQFGDLMGQAEGYGMPFLKTSRIASPRSPVNSPQSSINSPTGHSLPHTEDLPPRACAIHLCENALDDACALMRIVHLPTFWAKFDRAYTLTPKHYQDAERKFLPLLYVVLALGAVFAKSENSHLQRWGYENAIDQGCVSSHLNVQCRRLITILFMILFMQSSSRLSTCYTHIGIVLRSSIRMGLHRSISGHFNPIEQEIRKRIFWVVRKMDIYVAALLGLPMYLSDDDFDQENPLEIDDEFITSEEILPAPLGRLSVMCAFNAHTRLVDIMAKTTRYIYPVKSASSVDKQSYAVSHERIREIERDLHGWMEQLPMELRPGGEAKSHEIERLQQLLRMAYAYIQGFLYRPFLHYISPKSQAKSIDKRSYACAAACVSVSRNIIHISGEMKKKGLLTGSYWFYMYTTFFAILTLVFFVLENPNSSSAQDMLREAFEGRDTLASLARTSIAADRCMQTLKGLFEQLPRRLKGANNRLSSQNKRRAPSTENKEPSKSVQTLRRTPYIATRPASKSDDVVQERAKSSPGAIDQATTSPLKFQESSVYHQPHPMPDHRHGSNDTYSPDNMVVAGRESASATPSSSTQSTFGPSQQYPSSLPDMTEIMFPSADPFAYPNQPMMTLENQNIFQPDNTKTFSSCETPTSNTGWDGAIDSQIFTPLPPYMMQFPQHGLGFHSMGTLLSESTVPDSNVIAVNEAGGAWPPGQMQMSSGHVETPLNDKQPFGPGWIGQRYG
ncbi:MAG: hypothetical protein Q9195_000947 [Heterodermia aff. obscurata]